jgi:hypothetical protein
MKLLLILAAAMMMFSTAMAAPDTRCFELRIYHAATNKLDALNARFRDHTLKIFEKHGMTSIGYWIPVDNTNNVLIYMLAFPSADARAKAWKEFGSDPEWKEVAKSSEANGRLVTKVDSILLNAADFSPAIAPSSSDAPRLFELRTYHAATNKLDALNARFRDHTCALFDKHGLSQFGYWLPTEQKDGAGQTLIYILAHKDKAGADENWKAFRGDADWVKAKADSEANGPLTTKVESVYMKPTDYSPTK